MEIVEYLTDLLTNDPVVTKYINGKIEQVYKRDVNSDDDQVYYKLYNNEMSRVLCETIINLERA